MIQDTQTGHMYLILAIEPVDAQVCGPISSGWLKNMQLISPSIQSDAAPFGNVWPAL